MSEREVQIRRELEATAKSCQKTWGLGFPAISLTLLEPFLQRLRLEAFDSGRASTAESGR